MGTRARELAQEHFDRAKLAREWVDWVTVGNPAEMIVMETASK
jgi:hypothetical protein